MYTQNIMCGKLFIVVGYVWEERNQTEELQYFMKNQTYFEELPYEKFMKYGAETLSEAELLAIIIRTGTEGESALNLASKILHLPGYPNGLIGLHYATVDDFLKIKGIGKVKAVRLKCITELSKRLSETERICGVQMDRPETVASYYMERLRHRLREVVVLVMMDNKNRLMKDCIISEGTINASLMSAREIFLTAFQNQAVSILLLHNHPSGDPTPSISDIQITKKIAEASKLVEIPLIDHIIIGDNKYISFKEKGYL